MPTKKGKEKKTAVSAPETKAKAPKQPELKLQMLPLKSIKPFAGNPRIMNEDGLGRLTSSIAGFGFVNPILAWKNEKGELEIVAGHQRYKAATAANLETVPVIVLPFTREQALAYNIADNRTAELSQWDFPLLKDMFENLDNGEFKLDLTGFSMPEIEALIMWNKPLDESEKKAEGGGEKEIDRQPTEHVCPKCGYEW